MSLDITVTDESPAIAYFPGREGSASSAWESSWTGSPDSSYDSTHTQNNIAQGTSSHTTTLEGATLQLDFVGTAISLFGQGSAGAYSTTLDANSAVSGTPSGSLLATYTGLNASVKHTIVLKATQAQSLTFSNATFTIRSNIASSSVANTTVTAVTAGADNTFTTNSFFTTSGSGVSNLHQDDGYTRLDTDSSGASIGFSCSNASALFIYGTTNYNHQTFSVELDPSAGASQGARIFNGTSKWFVLDNLIFLETGMDPTQTYKVKLTNLIDGSFSDVHSVVMMNLPAEQSTSTSSSRPPSGSSTSVASGAGTSPSKSTSTGKTVGIAVGIVAVITAVVILAFLCWRRRRKPRQSRRQSFDGLTVTPFEDHPPGSLTSTAPGSAAMSLGHFGPTTSFYDPSPYAPTDSLYDGSASAPMKLGHYRPTGSFHDPSNYANSAANSVRHFRDGSTGAETRPFSDGSGNFDPYGGMAPPLQPFARGSATSLVGSSSGAPSGSGTPSGLGSQVGTSATAGAKPSKGPIPSDASTSRPIRQEIDAGRVPDPTDHEETLPPNYDPRWAS